MTDVSNTFLSRLFTAEFLVAFLGVVFAVGFAWSNVQSKVEAVQTQIVATEEKLDQLRSRQNQMDAAVGKIQTNIEVIKTSQVHTKETVEETKYMVRKLLDQRGD